MAMSPVDTRPLARGTVGVLNYIAIFLLATRNPTGNAILAVSHT